MTLTVVLLSSVWWVHRHHRCGWRGETLHFATEITLWKDIFQASMQSVDKIYLPISPLVSINANVGSSWVVQMVLLPCVNDTILSQTSSIITASFNNKHCVGRCWTWKTWRMLPWRLWIPSAQKAFRGGYSALRWKYWVAVAYRRVVAEQRHISAEILPEVKLFLRHSYVAVYAHLDDELKLT